MAAKSLDAEAIKGKLLQGSFMNNGPVLSQLTDPIRAASCAAQDDAVGRAHRCS